MSKGSPSLKAEPAPTITRPSFQGDVVTVDDVVYEALGWDASTTPARYAYRLAPPGTPLPAAPPSEVDSLSGFFTATEVHARQPDTVAAWRLARADTIGVIEQARAGVRKLQRQDGPWVDARFQEINPEYPGFAAARGHLMGLGGSTAANDLEVCIKAFTEIRASFDTTSLDHLLRRVAEVNDHRQLPELDGLLDHGDAAKSAGDRVAALTRQITHVRETLWPALRAKLDRPLPPGVVVTALPSPTDARGGRYPPPVAMTGRVELTFNPLET